MSTHRLVAAVAVGAGAVLAVAAAVLVPVTLRAEPRLAGADRIADSDGSERVRPYAIHGADVEGLDVDDLRVGGTYLVRAGLTGDVLLLVDAAGEGSLVDTSAAGEVRRVGFLSLSPFTTAVNVAPDGRAAIAWGGEVAVFDWNNSISRVVLAAPYDVRAVDVVGNESVVVGSGSGPMIDVLSSDGRTRLLGPTGDPDAQVSVDDPLGPIVSLVRLADERIAFVADTADGYRLHVLDETAVRPVDADIAGNPVASADTSPLAGDHGRLAMVPIAPGPDGRMLTVGIGDGGDPEINLIDVDSGETQLLARLDNVEPSIDEPISAALAGEDLIFTASGSVWRLADACDG